MFQRRGRYVNVRHNYFCLGMVSDVQTRCGRFQLERKCVLDYIDYVMCWDNGGTMGLLVELDDSGS